MKMVQEVKVGRHQCKALMEARLLAARQWPYAAYATLSFVTVENHSLPVAVACDKDWRLHYNPVKLATCDQNDAAAAILQDTARLLFKHPERCLELLGEKPTAAKLKRWQIASALAANSNLRASGINLPDGSQLPSQYFLEDEQTADWYYQELGKQADQDDSLPSPGPADGEPGAEPGTTEADAVGSCADGVDKPWEVAGIEEGDETDGLDKADQEMVIRKIADLILDSQKAVGTKSKRMLAWAKEIVSPRINPKTALMRAVRFAHEVASGTGDYSYRRPNRRNANPDVLRPSNVQPVPRITVIVDTSASMDKKDIALAMGLIGKVLNAFPNRDGLKVLCADTQVESVSKVFRVEQIQKSLAGGGGTSMARAIEQAIGDEKVLRSHGRQKPQVVVVCTDGETPWPASRTSVPVVACLTRKAKTTGSWRVPSWVKVIELFPERS